jgi:xanthine dehydrogenase accessory factor
MRDIRLSEMALSGITVGIRGAGDISSGVAWRLHKCGFRVFLTETGEPLSVRRKVSFCEAVYEREVIVEGVRAVLVAIASEIEAQWDLGNIPLLVDPSFEEGMRASPMVVVDGIMAKKNLGTTMDMADLVIALGPGFEAGKDAHFVIETNRGHFLGRVIEKGFAEPDTGLPGVVMGIGKERVLRAPATGRWQSFKEIGMKVRKGEPLGSVAEKVLEASIEGVIRGLIRTGTFVTEGLKVGDIDPRGKVENCYTISDKALAVAGGVLEAVLRRYGKALQ